MANSVPATSLTAEAVFGAVNLSAGVDASVNPCLPYLQVGGYQFWGATTNDRTAATLLTTSPLSFWQHTTPTTAQQYWYWVKTVDASGGVGDFYPATTTSTVTATPKTAANLDLSLTAYAIVVPADASGAVSSFAGAVTTATVLDGATDVSGLWTITATPTSTTWTKSGNTWTLTAAAADSGYLDVQAVRTGYPTLTARATVSKAKTGAAGAAGADAQALQLTASSQIFQITAAGANSPASITFTATPLGGLTGTPVFTVPSGTATLTGTGNTRTLTFANLGSDTATITATIGASSDSVTVAKLREGATGAAGAPGVDAVVALLSNEAHTLQADNAGVVGTFVGAATTITIYEGITNTTALWTITRTDVGTTSTLSGSTVTLTAMAGDTGYVSITATRSGYSNITKRFSLTKARAGATGAAGADAQALRLTASSQVFQITAAGANSPASITFTATNLGGLAGSPTFSVTSGTATLTGTGSTRTLTYANLTTDTATVQATVGAFSDTVTVAKLREGQPGTAGNAGVNAVVALLSNEAHTLQASADGTVGSFSGASATLTIFEGITATTGSWTLSKADTSCASTLSGSTVTITSMSADTAFVDITAARSGYTSIVKRFSLAKSREGATGATGATGANAQSLMLTATSQIFTVATAGTAAPTSITFTGTRLGGLTGTITFSVAAGTITLTGTGDTRAAAYSSMSTETATIQATCGGFTDTITVAKVRQGATGDSAITAILSNEAHLLPADAAGTVSSFSGATSTVTVYEGSTDVSASWTASRVDNGVTSTLSGKTVTVSAIAGDQGFIDITVARSGYSSIVKRFALAKAKQGVTGNTGTTGSTGPRGSKHFYVSGHSVWSDTAANTASNVEGGKMLNDIVTLYNSTSFSQTRFWNGSAWVQISEAIDGNLLISGSVGATQISASYVYAGTVSATQVTSGTLTGRTIQTAASGLRLVMDSPTNTLYCKDASNNDIAWMGGVSGGVVAGLSLAGATWPGVYGYTASNAPAINGMGAAASTYYTSLFASSSTDADGVAIYARIDGSGVAPAISGQGRAASANSHGIRGASGGSGLVGVSTSGGGYAFYKESGGIAPFTGQHDGLLLKTATGIEPGDIIVDVSVVAKPSVNDAITIVERSSQPNQTTCVGVFVSRNAMGEWAPAGLAEWIDGTTARGEPVRRRRRAKKHDALAAGYDLIVMNSLGEGLVNVCNEGGAISAGDLIVTSSRPGLGMRQADDLIRSSTVAKAREGATFENANQVRQIACIYLCG